LILLHHGIFIRSEFREKPGQNFIKAGYNGKDGTKRYLPFKNPVKTGTNLYLAYY
jgi:hypothetical protein